MTELDKRLHAYRDDLADVRLRGRVQANHFVAGQTARIAAPFADMLGTPSRESGLLTQALHGHAVTVFENRNGWSWVKRQADGYVGYVDSSALEFSDTTKTHMVSAPRTFVYPEADLKSPRCGYRSMGSLLAVDGESETRGTLYCRLGDGTFVIKTHLIEFGQWDKDPVAAAERLLHTPYLWGGDTGFGIDCSGLVFLSNMVCGKDVLRDSDMQANTLGEVIDPGPRFENLKRGDLVFWKGHVGMMRDATTLLHANGHTMHVAAEPLQQAIERIGYLYDQPTLVRRP